MKSADIAALKAKIAAAETRPAAASLTAPDLARVRQTVAAAVGERASMAPEHVREEQLLAHLGFDELDRIWLALDIEERLDLAEFIDVTGCRSVADLVRAASAAVAAQST